MKTGTHPDPSTSPPTSPDEARKALLDAAFDLSLQEWMATRSQDRARTTPPAVLRPGLRSALAVAAALVLMAGFGVWLRRSGDHPPALGWLDPNGGQVAVLREDGAQILPRDRVPLQEGDRISTGTGLARIGLPEGSRLDLHPGTDLAVEAPVFRMRRGVIEADVRPRPDERPMVIRTPDAVATVRGTRFRLEVKAGESILDVAEGEVGFLRLRDHQELAVRTGERASTGPSAVYTSEDGRWRVSVYLADGEPSDDTAPD